MYFLPMYPHVCRHQYKAKAPSSDIRLKRRSALVAATDRCRARRTPSMSRGGEIVQNNPSILRCRVGSLMMIHPSPREREKERNVDTDTLLHGIRMRRDAPKPRGSGHPSIPSDSADKLELGGMRSENPPRCSVHRRRRRSGLLVQLQEGT